MYTRVLILELDEPIQKLMAKGKLSFGHQVSRALLKIEDPGTRVKMARYFATHKTSIKAIERACKRIAGQEQVKDFDDQFNAMRYARRKANYAKEKPPDWDALRQVGKVPPWGTIVDAARETCDCCPLRSMAADSTCGGCGVVEFLRRLMVGK